MAKKRITLSVPAELLKDLKDYKVGNPIKYLENFFEEVEASDILAMMDDEGYWEEEDDDEEDDEDY